MTLQITVGWSNLRCCSGVLLWLVTCHCVTAPVQLRLPWTLHAAQEQRLVRNCCSLAMGAVLQRLGFGGDEGGGDAAVKRQAEGLSNPMYQLANLMGQVNL